MILIIVTDSIAIMRLEEGVRKQKPKMGESNTLHDEKDGDTFKSFRVQKRSMSFGRKEMSMTEAIENLIGMFH